MFVTTLGDGVAAERINTVYTSALKTTQIASQCDAQDTQQFVYESCWQTQLELLSTTAHSAQG